MNKYLEQVQKWLQERAEQNPKLKLTYCKQCRTIHLDVNGTKMGIGAIVHQEVKDATKDY